MQFSRRMLFAPTCLLLAASGCAEPARVDPNDPLTGTWIGKWDDEWTVMFIVKRSGNRYEAIYKWEEHVGHSFSRSKLRGEARGNSLSMGNIFFKLNSTEPDQATAKGKFDTPRTAHLVRIEDTDERVLTVAYVKAMLDATGPP